MVGITKYILTLLLLKYMILTSCSVFYQTVRVEVPNNYVGWCFIIPYNNTTVNPSPSINGKYQADSNGVVLIPTSLLNVKKDFFLKVYENEVDISESIRYAGSVYKMSSEDTSKYEFISFYLPPLDKRNIKDGTEYWRKKSYEHTMQRSNKFDSLMKVGKIIF